MAVTGWPRGTELDAEELEENVIRLEGLMMIVLGGVVAWQYMVSDVYRDAVFLLAWAIPLLGGAIRYACRRRLHLAERLLLLGSIVLYGLAQIICPASFMPVLAVVIVVANAQVRARQGLVAAVLLSPLVYWLVPNTAVMGPVLALVWIVAVLEWIGSQGFLTVLEWAWHSQRRANDLLDQLRQHQGELNRTVVALTEATRRLQHTGYQLAEARIRAEEARELKERFAANISHELRTPLNLIMGFSETIYYTPDIYGDIEWPLELRQDIGQIYQSSRQLSELVDDVLDLSRIDADQMPVQQELSDLGGVIRQATRAVQGLLRNREVEVLTELPTDLPTLWFDRTRIRQVLLNLLKNAARFTEQGWIKVSVEVESDRVLVHVQDTGQGIPESDIDRIFDEFHQVDMSIRRQQEGAGLGLAISRRFVQLHGGTIGVVSTLGQGSTFTFSLPREGAIAAPMLKETPRAAGQKSRRDKTLLLVADSPEVGASVARYLSDYQVVTLPRDADLAREIEERHPKAVLLNVPPLIDEANRMQQQLKPQLPERLPLLVCSIPNRGWLTKQKGIRWALGKPLSRQALEQVLAELPTARDMLIVDDDRGFVQLVRRYLSTLSDDQDVGRRYTLRRAYSGEAGLEQVRTKCPDLILLDLTMPRMDGFTFLEHLQAHERWRRVPVAIVTASDYGADLVAEMGTAVQVWRQRGWSTVEALQGIQGFLTAMGTRTPG